MIDLILEKQLSLEFQINIDNNENTPDITLGIEIDNNIMFSIKGRVENNLALVDIPSLEQYSSIIQKDQLMGRLEVYVDGRVFYPWTDIFKIVKEVQVGASVVQVREEKKVDSIKVNLTQVKELEEEKPKQKGVIITLDNGFSIKEKNFEKGQNIEIVSEKRKGFTRVNRNIEVSDIRIEKGDYIKVVV